MIDSYLMLIDEIQLEEEYRNELIIEGVVGNIFNAIKAAIRFIKEKICGLIKKFIGIFIKDKKDSKQKGNGNNGGSSSNNPSKPKNNEVKVTAKVKDNKSKTSDSKIKTSNNPSKPKNNEVKVTAKVKDNTVSDPTPKMIKTYSKDTYNKIVKFFDNLKTTINEGIFQINREGIIKLINTLDELISAMQLGYFSEYIPNLNKLSSKDENDLARQKLDSDKNDIEDLKKSQQILNSISPDLECTTEEAKEFALRVSNVTGIPIKTIKNNPSIIFTKIDTADIMGTFVELLQEYYNETKQVLPKIEDKLKIVETLNEKSGKLMKNAIDTLQIAVEMLRVSGLYNITLAKVLLEIKMKLKLIVTSWVQYA